MAQFGSGRSIIAQNQSAVSDSNGNLIVSPDDSWTGSPLGIAARNQTTIGVPNGTFNILPADPVADINAANPLPYWDWAPDDGFTAAMAYDTTTQTNSVEIDPTAVGTALGTAILKTRIPITNDEGLDIRQYVSSSLVQVIKVAGTDKWTATLTSQYYDTAGVAIGTPYVIGTIGERGTATNLASYTNASGPISTSAAELELAYKVVVGTASPTYALQVKSVMVATEYGVIGGGGGGTGFIPLSVITTAGDLIVGASAGSAIRLGKGASNQVLTVKGTATGGLSWQDLPSSPTYVPGWSGTFFTSSGTFTVPAGVNYVTVWATGGGQGGQSGGLNALSATAAGRGGGNGGRSSFWALRRDIYVGNVASVAVGIGAGGAGGTARNFTKAAGASTTSTQNSTDGSNGGDTTFGAYFTVQGASLITDTATGFYGAEQVPGTAGGSNGAATGGAGGTGIAHTMDTYGAAPFVYGTHFTSAGSAGVTATGSGGTGASGAGGAANAVSGFSGSGGGGGGGSAASSSTAGTGATGGPGGGGSGGGAAARFVSGAPQTIVVTGGAGAPAQQWGGGGGGGGAAALAATSTTAYGSATITMNSGAGGAGKDGRVYVFWLVNV